MDVASRYPAVTDDNGNTWYRPQFVGKSPPTNWGWTSDRDQAHPSYWLIKDGVSPGTDNPPRKEPSVTEMTVDGTPDRRRFSEFMRYELPPEIPREDVQYDGYGRYKLPSPTTGRPTSYTRATTVAGTTADHGGLLGWKVRSKVAAVLRAKEAWEWLQNGSQITDEEAALGAAYREYQKAVDSGTSRDIDKAIELIDNLTGGADARELGGAVHDWLGELDMGRALLHQLPDYIQPYASSYQKALERAGLVAVPEYTERVVLNDRGKEAVAGRIDRMYRVVETGELYLGDLKTSKTLDLSVLEYGVQFAVYGWATLMLELDGLTWRPMPEINDEMVLCVHVPSDQPERSQVVPYNLYVGGECMVTSLQVREERRTAKSRIWGQTTPIPSTHSVRYVQARQALQAMKGPHEALAIKETFEDVWDDTLNEFGAQCFELINQ